MFNLKLSSWYLQRARRLLTPAVCLLIAAGCGDGGGKGVTGPGGTVPLTLRGMGMGSASGSGAMVSPRSAGAAFVTASGDTIPVTFTTALVVVRDVWFKPAEDDDDENDSLGTGHDDDAVAWNLSASHDSLGHDDDDGDEGAPIRFRGPFVVNLLTQSAESLDTQLVPPGVYRNAKGHIWPLRADDWNALSYDFLIGSSVYLQGTVDGEGGGEFTYEATIRHLFKIGGEFIVEESTPATAFITFDISSWLRGRGGAFLDPREPENDKLIQHAIIKSLKVGMDRNHNGHCDDRTFGEDD